MYTDYQNFEELDIRTGTIVSAKFFEKAIKPAYQMEIDFGTEAGIKKSSAQITKLYTAEELVGRQVVAIINFPPRQIANFISECLVLGVVGENKEVVLLQPDRKVANGLTIG
jgi:tRNA-binding protein